MAGCNGPTSDAEVDAFSALQYLTTQPFVIPDRVAVLGFSLGGVAGLGDVESNVWEQIYHAKFRGAVAFCRACAGDCGNVGAPTLILIGEKDDWAWAYACRDMVDDAHKKGAPIELIVDPMPLPISTSQRPSHLKFLAIIWPTSKSDSTRRKAGAKFPSRRVGATEFSGGNPFGQVRRSRLYSPTRVQNS